MSKADVEKATHVKTSYINVYRIKIRISPHRKASALTQAAKNT